jgi:hypothetical protein
MHLAQERVALPGTDVRAVLRLRANTSNASDDESDTLEAS